MNNPSDWMPTFNGRKTVGTAASKVATVAINTAYETLPQINLHVTNSTVNTGFEDKENDVAPDKLKSSRVLFSS